MLKRIVCWGIMALLIGLPGTALSLTPREAVVLEAFYALSSSADGQSRQADPSCRWLVSEWNYLLSDESAFNVVRGWYGSYASVHSEFRDLWNYGYYWRFGQRDCRWWRNNYQYDAGVGRGGQCKFFANLLVYRSSAYRQRFPTYATMWQRGTPIGRTRPGDVIFTYNSGLINHVAIVVAIISGNPDAGTVSIVDVVDSNWTGWRAYRCEEGRTDNPEVISRHILQGDELAKYRVFNIY